MSDAVTLLLILPGLLLAIIFADAAGDRGAATYRATNYAVRAADNAADQIAADPQDAALWARPPTRSKTTGGCPPGATACNPTRGSTSASTPSPNRQARPNRSRCWSCAPSTPARFWPTPQ
ncbi:MAG: hypothetical protein KTV68_03655 [Acidimicrobiia bacterium]|nr:hypothetical protein [Acidimicrobiia bacterium]